MARLIDHFQVALPVEPSEPWIAVFSHGEQVDPSLHRVVWSGHADSPETAIDSALEAA